MKFIVGFLLFFQFNCKTGGKIRIELKCDGKPDCLDNSDETVHECYDSIECPSSWFRCVYGACIPKSKVCDKIQDCFDNSDEMSFACSSFYTKGVCKQNEFHCRNKKECISIDELCNGVPDCSDKSDETLDECAKFNCTAISSRFFQCKYGACIPMYEVGNDIYDCIDNSDEDELSIVKKQRKSELQCKDDESFCNGVIDCANYEDEISPDCINIICPSPLLSCKNTEGCIRRDMICDGKFDCLDNSDEAECLNDDKQELFYCGSGERIRIDEVCNGFVNCKDASDESLNLLLKDSNCPASCIKCIEGRCILQNDTSEYPVDCLNDVCFKRLDQCQKDEFLCNSGDCISTDEVCNGIQNCEDSSDETITLCWNFQCNSTQFQCRYGACIARSNVCDGSDECIDNSDEVLHFCENGRIVDVGLLDNHVWERNCENLESNHVLLGSAGNIKFSTMFLGIVIFYFF